MIFQQFEAKGLSQYSYAIGSRAEAEVAIIDPERDIKTYITYAAENRLKIKYVIETHIHADYASGARALAEKSGAELLLSAYDDGQKYAYGYEHTEIKDGDRFDLGHITLQVLHTPGHTPEHISLLVYDKENSSTEPKMMFSGDFLFVGSVGRPDLLGNEDKLPLAKQLYKSVQNLNSLPDALEIFPGHGAGTLCGAGLGNAPSSTLGDERQNNPYLQKMNENEFVEKVLSSVPHFPDYYLKMKELNSAGAPLLEGLSKLPPLTVEEFADAVKKNCVILDVRHPLAFGGGHIEGAVNIPTTDQISFYGGTVIPYDLPLYIVLDDPEKVRDIVQALARVGLDNAKGYLKPNFNAWANRGNDFMDLPQASVLALNDFMDIGEPITVVDVRSDSEWKDGHIEGAKHAYLGDITKNINSLAKNKEETIFCVCGGGFRSSIASSLLMKAGYDNVYNVFGGMTAWKAAGLPTTRK